MRAVLFLVSGLVQGVAFRASARREAERLGISGYAKNLPNGCVEVLACGDESAIDQLKQWLWHGPPMARVENVKVTETNSNQDDGFRIL